MACHYFIIVIIFSIFLLSLLAKFMGRVLATTAMLMLLLELPTIILTLTHVARTVWEYIRSLHAVFETLMDKDEQGNILLHYYQIFLYHWNNFFFRMNQLWQGINRNILSCGLWLRLFVPYAVIIIMINKWEGKRKTSTNRMHSILNRSLKLCL